MALLSVGSVVSVVGCTSDQATPIADVTTTAQVTPHLLQPTEQMKELARQQCRDDPTKAQGVVNAVDPGNPNQVLASVALDCADVRAGGTGETTTLTTTAG